MQHDLYTSNLLPTPMSWSSSSSCFTPKRHKKRSQTPHTSSARFMRSVTCTLDPPFQYPRSATAAALLSCDPALWIVWTPDPSGRARKSLGNNLSRKCLAGMPRFLNPANFIFRPSTRLVRYYSNIQNFYVLPYIHFLPLVELPGKVIPQTLPCAARRVWGPDYLVDVKLYAMLWL